jgi:hypothetical protein
VGFFFFSLFEAFREEQETAIITMSVVPGFLSPAFAQRGQQLDVLWAQNAQVVCQDFSSERNWKCNHRPAAELE